MKGKQQIMQEQWLYSQREKLTEKGRMLHEQAVGELLIKLFTGRRKTSLHRKKGVGGVKLPYAN